MFYYFGRKFLIAKHYPAPAHDIVIEPFAGSMGYTLYYKPYVGFGIELDKAVHDVWHATSKLSQQELLNYPEPQIGERVIDRWAMMAAGSHGTARAKSHKWTERMQRDLRKQKRMAAKNLDYAKNHIDYVLGTYKDAPDVEATWFVDPPYQKVSRGYNKSLDYGELAEWCKSRKGLVIVCEQLGADWLPFVPLIEIKGTNNKRTTEVYWMNK